MSNKILGNRILKSRILPYSVVFLSISLILSYLEILFPLNIGNLGIKIGLANIVTILSIQILNIKWTFFINILRILIIGILFGNLIRFSLSLAGFLLSFVVMIFTLRTLNFSIVSTSIFGGVFHNIGQIIALSFIMKNKNILSLIPIYILIGVLTGFVIGILTYILYKKIQILHLNNR